MNIYLLSATAGYDEYDGFVIAANTAVEARRMAQGQAWHSDIHFHRKIPKNHNQNFLNPAKTTCRKVGETARKKPYIILASNIGS